MILIGEDVIVASTISTKPIASAAASKLIEYCVAPALNAL